MVDYPYIRAQKYMKYLGGRFTGCGSIAKMIKLARKSNAPERTVRPAVTGICPAMTVDQFNCQRACAELWSIVRKRWGPEAAGPLPKVLVDGEPVPYGG